MLLTHIARSSGLRSGRRAPGEDPSSPYPRQYVGFSQGSTLETRPGRDSAGVEEDCRHSAHPPLCQRQTLLRPSPPLGPASGPDRPARRLSRVPQSLRPPPPPGAASPPPSLWRILQGAGLRLEAAAPSGRPQDWAGLRTADGSNDTASRVLPPTRLSCASF